MGDYGRLPLSFTRNAGQTDPRVRYYAKGAGFAFFFTRDRVAILLGHGESRQVLHLRFLGGSGDARITPAQRRSGTVNHFSGSRRSQWRTGLKTYATLRYHELWPGIDMVFRGREGKLVYEFQVQPRAKLSDIRLAYRGARSLSVASDGDLLVRTPVATVRDQAPRSFQTIEGRRVERQSRFRPLAGSRNSFGFAVRGHDPNSPLLIDPGLAYSTYIGSGGDLGQAIAVDGEGSAYIAGYTFSARYPTTPGSYHGSYQGGGTEAFVTKLNPPGTALAYSTFLGGASQSDHAFAIAVDDAGSAYATGYTNSSDFPTTPDAVQRASGGRADVWVVKLHPSGSRLEYSTYLGGADDDNGYGIAVDAAGNAYVAGYAPSDNFPTTPGAWRTNAERPGGGFVTKLNPAGTTLEYSTFLGTTNPQLPQAITVDGAGRAHVAGHTTFNAQPPAPEPHETVIGPTWDADIVVTQLN